MWSCVNPPGAQFYPFCSTKADGSSATEFGSLLLTTYPAAGFTTVQRFENFNSGNLPNACPVG